MRLKPYGQPDLNLFSKSFLHNAEVPYGSSFSKPYGNSECPTALFFECTKTFLRSPTASSPTKTHNRG